MRDDPPGIARAGERPATRDDVTARVRRFAALRAAQRALGPSTPDTYDAQGSSVIAGVRERLAALTAHFDGSAPDPAPGPLTEELHALDDALDGFARTLAATLERIPLPQLRASLAGRTHPQRVEVAALLELCLDAEPAPGRYLRAVDFLVTLLCTGERDGRWFVEIDPPNLNDTVRRRCTEMGDVDTAVEASIAQHFQDAAERVASGGPSGEVMKEISAFKAEVAAFYFSPSVLRCIVGYNVAARNHFEDRIRREREKDSAIDDELGIFAPLADQDPHAGAESRAPLLPPHESPGVIAVQEAMRRRLQRTDPAPGPARDLASGLDLGVLEPIEKEALRHPERAGSDRIIRMTVVLGHLALSLPKQREAFTALGLQESHLDAWICGLGEEVQQRIDMLIRDAQYDRAVRLGDVKSRYLAAVLHLARRRLGKHGERAEADEPLTRDAIRLLREQLQRQALDRRLPLFHDLLGGGWRRAMALASVLALVGLVGIVEYAPSTHPRRTRILDAAQVADISRILDSAYLDASNERSLFVGTVNARWGGLAAGARRHTAEAIRAKAEGRGAEEILLFDRDHVLQAHFIDGNWRTRRAWKQLPPLNLRKLGLDPPR